MDKGYLIQTAQDLVNNQRGILAADESTSTIKKRFDTIGVESNPENHRRYRQLLFTTPEIEKYIGGVIMFDETVHQTTYDGKHFTQLLAEQGIMPGIKVDEGKVDLPNFPGEQVTEGIDGLRDRLIEYKKIGLRFAKWRAVYSISDIMPSRTLINSNNELLARYAAYCQEQDMVPIIEPEVLIDGNHSIDQCAEVTEKVLKNLFEELNDHRVILEATILKTNMVVPGKDSGQEKNIQQIAEFSVTVAERAVPVAVPSVVFLSGGLSPEESTQYLDKINELGPHPWELNFSFGRALQQPVLQAWLGKDENVEVAQRAFLKRARLNSLALRGEYQSSMEDD